MNRRNLAIALTLVTIGGTTSACVPVEVKPGFKPTSSCMSAFSEASRAMNDHYENDPLFGAEYDDIYADGKVTKKEQKKLSKMIADEEAAFASLVDPVYDACSGYEDLYASAYAHRDNADWALQESEGIDREDAREIFVVSYCLDNEDRPACFDFVAEDWR